MRPFTKRTEPSDIPKFRLPRKVKKAFKKDLGIGPGLENEINYVLRDQYLCDILCRQLEAHSFTKRLFGKYENPN